MAKKCEMCGKKLTLFEGKLCSLKNKKLLLCQECLTREEDKKFREEAEKTKQKMDKVFTKHRKILEEKRKPLYEKVGIKEEEAQEIERKLQHIRIDIIKEDKNYAEFLKKIFPNLTKEERYKIYIFKWITLSNTKYDSEMKLLYNI